MGPTRHILSQSVALALSLCLVLALMGGTARAQPIAASGPGAVAANGEADATAPVAPESARPVESAPGSPPSLRRLAGHFDDDAVKPAAASARPAAADAAPSKPPRLGNDRLPLGRSTSPGSGPSSNRSPPVTGSGGMSWILSTMAALGIVIALILAARWAYQKLGGRVVHNHHPAIEVLGRTSIAPKNHVVLLRVGQRVLVVGDSPQGLNPLANLDDPDEVADLLQAVASTQDQSISRSFQAMVQRFSGDYEGPRLAQEEGLDDGEHRFDRARDSLSGLLSKVRTMAGPSGGGKP